MFPDLTADDIFRLESKRLWLRWPRAGDAAAIRSFAKLPEIARMTAEIPHPYPAGEAERFIFRARAENADGRALVLAVSQKAETRQTIGIVSATLSGAGEVELGFMIAPSQWNKGYATEAVQALIEAVFALTPAERILASARAENPASRRVLEKCGFAYVDSGLDLLPARGGLHSCDRFELGRNGWASIRPSRGLPAMTQQSPDARLPILAQMAQRQG